MFLTWRRFAGAVSAVAVLAAGLALWSGAGAAAQPGLADEVGVRDRLIADQENLLNAYRCMFGVDTEVVPGGCPDPDTVSPGAAPPNPTRQDVEARDALVASQEELLNAYRCRYGIDTQLVPEGCTETAPTTEPVAQNDDPVCQKRNSFWCLTTDNVWLSVVYYTGELCAWAEVNSRYSNTCNPWQGDMSMFPHNCGPSLRNITTLPLEFNTLEFPTLGHHKYDDSECNFGDDVWYYGQFKIDFKYGFAICNKRDANLGRLFEVCVHPDDPSANDLKPWQYLAISPNSDRDAVNPGVQKPYLNFDLPRLRSFCQVYPQFRICPELTKEGQD